MRSKNEAKNCSGKSQSNKAKAVNAKNSSNKASSARNSSNKATSDQAE